MNQEILNLIPARIRKHITHPGDIAQIEGFQELFTHLNEDPGSKALRQLVVSYFAGSPSLREHLSQ